MLAQLGSGPVGAAFSLCPHVVERQREGQQTLGRFTLIAWTHYTHDLICTITLGWVSVNLGKTQFLARSRPSYKTANEF